MSGSQIFLALVAVAVFGLALRRGLPTAQRALVETRQTLFRVLPMLAVAMPMAAFLSELIPSNIASAWLGPDSGLGGVLVASFAGGLIPGGPYASFPLVLTFLKAGAGPAQMVALITGWAVLAFHRMAVWELPILGGRFVLIRVLSSLLLPMLAGVLAMLLLPLFPHLAPPR